MRHQSVVASCLLLLLAGSWLVAGNNACPESEIGEWNGRWYYYCSSGDKCQGSPVIGSNDTQIGDLSCNSGDMCNHLLQAGGSGDVHDGLPRTFVGQSRMTPNPFDSNKQFAVHADFFVRATLSGIGPCSTGENSRYIRVLLVSGNGTCTRTPLIVAQEFNGSPANAIDANAECHDGVFVWSFKVAKTDIARHWTPGLGPASDKLLKEFQAAAGVHMVATSIMDY